MRKFEFLAHPADVKIHSFGKDLQELFYNSAIGMMVFLFGEGIQDIRTRNHEEIVIQSVSLESLLVDWLSELLYLSNSHYRAYTHFDFNNLDEYGLKATIYYLSAEAKDDIKAVTYHDLSIQKVDGGYEATIVFDI